MNDIFYDIQKLKLSSRMSLLNDANMLSTKVFVDKLDMNISHSRQRTDMSFHDIMLKFTKKCHMVVIERKERYFEGNIGEIGFCTLGQKIDYFLFIYLPVDKLNIIVDKYKLKLLN